MSGETEKKNMPEWLPKVAIIFFINLLLLSLACWGFEYAYKDKVYPGVFIGKISLGGKTQAEARAVIDSQIQRINTEGIMFSFESGQTTVYPTTLSADGSFTYDLITFSPEATLDEAYYFGRARSWPADLKDRLAALIFRRHFKAAFTADEEKLARNLKDNFKELETPFKNADAIVKIGKDGKISAEILEEEEGKLIRYDKGLNILKSNLAVFDNSPVGLSAETKRPDILAQDCLDIEKKAELLLEAAPFSIVSDNKKWAVDKEGLAAWLVLASGKEGSSNPLDKVAVAVSKDKAAEYLTRVIGEDINKKAIDAKFQMVDGRLTEFQGQSDGQEIDMEKTLAAIDTEIIKGGKKEVGLAVKKVKSDIGLAEVNNLGLVEIIGTGESNFAGSPKNRRHNIKVGAAAVNGTLIKPGEEFSLLKVLGDISSSTGYLPELVIKDNKTIPEYGGGLCQIGTTAFRAALGSGLPITQRRNHSYRVVYYEPAGTDATIYDPWPDFRFINDTPNHILIQSRIEGDKLSFDVWGAKDGRIVEKTKPTIYNIVKPAPARIVETLNLKPGEKKCTESAHNGADAFFDYKVTYAGGDVKEKRFSSHYVPWQEVCLLGVSALSASSTPITQGGTATSSATSTQ